MKKSKQLNESIEGDRNADSKSIAPVRDSASNALDYSKELFSLARHTIGETAELAWGGAKTFAAPVFDVFNRADGEEGTELRNYIGLARKSLNARVFAAQVQWKNSKEIADAHLVPVKSVLNAAQQHLMKADELRREHPEMAASGLALIVGVPSLLICTLFSRDGTEAKLLHVIARGKLLALRNSVLAVSAGAAACYGSDKWIIKQRK